MISNNIRIILLLLSFCLLSFSLSTTTSSPPPTPQLFQAHKQPLPTSLPQPQQAQSIRLSISSSNANDNSNNNNAPSPSSSSSAASKFTYMPNPQKLQLRQMILVACEMIDLLGMKLNQLAERSEKIRTLETGKLVVELIHRTKKVAIDQILDNTNSNPNNPTLTQLYATLLNEESSQVESSLTGEQHQKLLLLKKVASGSCQTISEKLNDLQDYLQGVDVKIQYVIHTLSSGKDVSDISKDNEVDVDEVIRLCKVIHATRKTLVGN